MGAFLRAFRDKINKNGQYLGGRMGFRGEIFAPPKKSAPFLESKFYVDYDFAIKHDSIQSDDWVMNFVPCQNRVEPQK